MLVGSYLIKQYPLVYAQLQTTDLVMIAKSLGFKLYWGGSSGGAGAAVASGIHPIAEGSDGGINQNSFRIMRNIWNQRNARKNPKKAQWITKLEPC